MRGNQYLNMLDKDEAFKFRYNFFRHRLSDITGEYEWTDYLNSYYDSFGEFISNAFVFATTNEGHEYWNFIRHSARDGIKYMAFKGIMKKLFGIEMEEKPSDELNNVLEELNIKKQKSKMTKLNLDINPFLCTIMVSAKIDGVEERNETTYNPHDYPDKVYAMLGDRVFNITIDYSDCLSVVVKDDDDDTTQEAKIRIIK